MFATRLNISSFFFFNDTATSEIYTLSLHDALPICNQLGGGHVERRIAYAHALRGPARAAVAGHLVGRPLLDDDLRAVRNGCVEARKRGGNIERDAVAPREHGEAVGAGLVGDVAVCRDAIGADVDDVHVAAAHQVAG